MNDAQITHMGALSVQVCVPASWTDEMVIRYAEENYPCGTRSGWHIRTDPAKLEGHPVRNPCASAERPGFVHVMLDA